MQIYPDVAAVWIEQSLFMVDLYAANIQSVEFLISHNGRRFELQHIKKRDFGEWPGVWLKNSTDWKRSRPSKRKLELPRDSIRQLRQLSRFFAQIWKIHLPED